MILHAFEQACLFMPLTLALFMSYKILKITDLATEASYLFGAALFAVCISMKCSLPTCMAVSLCGGALVGSITSTLQRFLGFSDLISGILTIFLLHSVSLQVMGRPNISLYDKPTLVRLASQHFGDDFGKLVLALSVTLFLAAFLYLLLSSRLGLTLRAFGNNPRLLRLFGKSDKLYCYIGLMLSNMLAALGGSLTCQFQGFTDITMATGVVLTALAAVIIGERISSYLATSSVAKQLLCCFAGILLYFVVIHSLMELGVEPMHLKMMTALFTICILAMKRREAVA
ncbi:MAG: hypothetical protein JSR46_08655 [Verrucomicrobia bacterium]|nr:hypothetical protein [Verrucomicrobiota bacterium]